MPRKGENIYKRKDGRWEARYIKSRTESGKDIYGYVYARSYREVKQKLLFSIQTTQVEKKQSANPVNPQNKIIFGDLADSWMKTIKPQVKESTYMKYSNSLKNYILPKLSHIEIGQINYSLLETYANELLLSGGSKNSGLSSKTVSDVIAIVREIILFANRHGYEVNYIGSGIIIKQDRQELTILTQTEQKLFQKHLIEEISNKNLGLLFCLFTGIRVGEICSLRWEDISLEEKQIYIHSTMQRLQCESGSSAKTKVIITTPKSKCSIRKIPIPDCMVSLIEEHFSNCSGYVLTGHETKFIEPRTMQNHFKRALKDCQIREVNFHALRHTFATRCVELGFDIKSLSEILGHASVNITMNRYVHPSMDLKRDNMNKLSELFAVR